MSSASKQANEQASGPVMQSGFLIILAHSGEEERKEVEEREERGIGEEKKRKGMRLGRKRREGKRLKRERKRCRRGGKQRG